MNKILVSIIAFLLGIIVMFSCLVLASFIYKSIFENNMQSANLNAFQILYMAITYACTSFFSAYALTRFNAKTNATWLPYSYLILLVILMGYSLYIIPTPLYQLFIYIASIAIAGYFAIKMGYKLSAQKL
jgi:hypothetical protein